jgi:hypothetical protein
MDYTAFELQLPPLAPVLLESMRAIGYSFESALADIIDNSISARAKSVQIRFLPYGEPYLTILDDGDGMTGESLVCAMRHGSRDPRLERQKSDLGRFGLGLKTASLSQCRTLTVVSKRNGAVSARRWDLDLIAQRQDWILTGVAQGELEALPQYENLLEQKHGTLVVWQEFDRLAAGESSIEAALGERVDRARDHLSLVFHRFISPGTARDPFLTNNPGTQAQPEETFLIEGHRVLVAPFILPHMSRLSADDLRLAGGEEGLRRNQGFYVYRNRRLISWGSWFRLIRQEEMTKLARVRVDIPNALDHLWTLDVKKSAAYPPEAVRNNLKVTVDRICDGSRRVYTFRGRRANTDGVIHLWDRRAVRGGLFYSINREHPLLAAIESVMPEADLPLLQKFLQNLERAFPFDALYADMASERRPATYEAGPKQTEFLFDLALQLLNAVGIDSPAASSLLKNLGLVEPFSRYPEKIESLKEKLAQCLPKM